jgi:hypothetical protein
MADQAIVTLRVNAMKGVIAKKRVLEVDGTPHELQIGDNRINLPAGVHQLTAYMRALIGAKMGPSKPLMLSLHPGQTIDLVYHLVVGGTFSREFRLEIVGQEAPPPAPVAAWAWVFVVPCIAIPVVALGGGIPVMLGVLGAGGCLMVAKSQKLPVPARVGLCLGITVACWAAFGLLIAAFLRR